MAPGRCETFDRAADAASHASDRLRAIGRSTSDDGVCQAVADRARELNPSAMVLVTLYDPARRVLRPRALVGLGSLAQRVFDLIGGDPRRMSATLEDITSEERRLYVSGRMVRLPHGLHSVAAGKVPAPVLDVAAGLLGVREVHGVGFALNGHPYGGVMIAPRGGATLEGARELEALVAFAGAVIRRLHADAEKTEAIARMAGGMAHEYNNLLSVILGNISYALDVGVPDAAQREALEEGRDAAERAARLTHQLLAFGRRDAIWPEILRLDDVVARARPRLEAAAAPLAIAIDLGATGGWIFVDRAQVERLLADLVVELCGWSLGHGAIELATRRAEIDAEDAASLELPPGAYVEVRLRTAGAPGHAAAQDARVEPFLGAIHAYGMSVAAAEGALHQGRGALHVEVAAGPVTIVRLVWPEAQAPPARPSVARAVTRFSGHARVLVVDDDEAVARAMARGLESAGYEVTTASSGARALEAVVGARFDAVITGAVVGDEGGPELAARMRAITPTLRVVYVSNDSREALGPAIGPDAQVVRKPASRDELHAAVEAALRAT